MSPTTALVIAVAAGLLVAITEWLHQRRTSRVARLAFGRRGSPAAWTAIALPLRSVAMAAMVWGMLMLATLDPKVDDDVTPLAASKHLLIAFDVSPSMHTGWQRRTKLQTAIEAAAPSSSAPIPSSCCLAA